MMERVLKGFIILIGCAALSACATIPHTSPYQFLQNRFQNVEFRYEHSTKIQWYNFIKNAKTEKQINDLINTRPYVSDMTNYHVKDYWADPQQFLKNGGDCEDFAIAKYFAMRYIGYADYRLKILVVQLNASPKVFHAVLMIDNSHIMSDYDGEGKIKTVKQYKRRWRFIYSVNMQSVEVYNAPIPYN